MRRQGMVATVQDPRRAASRAAEPPYAPMCSAAISEEHCLRVREMKQQRRRSQVAVGGTSPVPRCAAVIMGFPLHGKMLDAWGVRLTWMDGQTEEGGVEELLYPAPRGHWRPQSWRLTWMDGQTEAGVEELLYPAPAPDVDG
jgi:hypothetical protein